LVRIFRPVVEPFVLPVLYARQNLAFGRAIAPQLIGNDYTRNIVQLFEEFAEKAFGRLFVASTLRRVCRAHCHLDPPLARDSGFSR